MPRSIATMSACLSGNSTPRSMRREKAGHRADIDPVAFERDRAAERRRRLIARPAVMFVLHHAMTACSYDNSKLDKIELESNGCRH